MLSALPNYFYMTHRPPKLTRWRAKSLFSSKVAKNSKASKNAFMAVLSLHPENPWRIAQTCISVFNLVNYLQENIVFVSFYGNRHP